MSLLLVLVVIFLAAITVFMYLIASNLYKNSNMQNSQRVQSHDENSNTNTTNNDDKETVQALKENIAALEKENLQLKAQISHSSGIYPNLDALKSLSKTSDDFKKIYKVLAKVASEDDRVTIQYAVANGYSKVRGGTWNYDIVTNAGYKNDFRLAQLLVDFGADPNSTDGTGCGALRFFCYEGNLPAVRYFASLSKVDINAAREDGFTPLMGAAKWGQHEVVEYLASLKNININARNKDGNTALKCTTYDEIKNILKSKGCVE